MSREENSQLNDSLAQSLLQVNNMSYKLPPEISIASARHHVTEFAQQSSYQGGETIVWDSQTGSLFVDGKGSYIRWTLTPSGAGDFGSGSSYNIVNRVVVRTRTGKEWCRVEDANLLNKYLKRYKCPRTYFENLGKAEGFPTTGADGSLGDGATVLTAGYTFCLPLSTIPCFEQDKLLPPQIMEGCRIEISLERASVAWFGAGGAVASYTVSKPVIKWDAYEIADQFKRKINEMSAKQGLNLIHKEYFHTIVANNSNQFNFDIKKAAAKALKSMVVSRLAADINDGTKDSMASEAYDYTKQQAHIGSVYYPNQPLETDDPTLKGLNESYYNTMLAMDKGSCDDSCDVSPLSYSSTGVATAGVNNKDAMIAVNLNKSGVSDMSGMSVNNSRSLLFDLTFSAPQNRQLDCYLQHLRAVKVYQSNVDVKD